MKDYLKKWLTQIWEESVKTELQIVVEAQCGGCGHEVYTAALNKCKPISLVKNLVQDEKELRKHASTALLAELENAHFDHLPQLCMASNLMRLNVWIPYIWYPRKRATWDTYCFLMTKSASINGYTQAKKPTKTQSQVPYPNWLPASFACSDCLSIKALTASRQ